jgi:predicted 3-demethylubiquinone-9 3-methyltransferase (glyoxalase superfamily)
MKSKNTICLWFDKDSLDAARFYAATFPNSEVSAVCKAPADYPSGKAGDVLTVEFTVLGSLGPIMADHTARADDAPCGGWR